jgi:hypothetical protein
MGLPFLRFISPGRAAGPAKTHTSPASSARSREKRLQGEWLALSEEEVDEFCRNR